MKIICIVLLTMLLFVSCGENVPTENIFIARTAIDFSIPTMANITANIYLLPIDSGESIDNTQIAGGTYISPENLKYVFSHTGLYGAGSH